MDEKLNLFRQTAQESGYSPEEVDSFLQTQETTGSSDQGFINKESVFKGLAEKQGFAPEEVSAATEMRGQLSEEEALPSTFKTTQMEGYGILPTKAPITQRFGNYNPRIE